MPIFGKKSMNKLVTCHQDIQTVMHEAIKIYDFSVIQGRRSLETQFIYFKKGRKLVSKNHDPELASSWIIEDKEKVITNIDGYIHKGMHNYDISRACDIAPYPIDWSGSLKARARFYFLSGIIFGVSDRLYEKEKIKHLLRWGGDWDQDGIRVDKDPDESFFDGGHVEI